MGPLTAFLATLVLVLGVAWYARLLIGSPPKRCDWRELVISEKAPDRVIGWDDRGPGQSSLPIIEKGTEVRTYRICHRRPGHRGEHGYGPLRRRWYRLTRWARR